MTAATVAFIGALLHEHPPLLPVLAEHLTDNEGEVLPHLVMSDIIRWLVDHRSERPDVVASVFRFLNAGFATGDQDVRDLIGASAVEMIPAPGVPGSEFRELLNPELAAVDLWSAGGTDSAT